MGKGGDDTCNSQSMSSMALLTVSDDSRHLLAGAGRILYTYQLAHESTGLSAAELLRNPRNGETTTNPKDQNRVMVHNALLHLVPEAFQDSLKYKNALDLYQVLLLDGDLKANHLWHYYDDRIAGWWTPGAGAAARAWYGLPKNKLGELKPEGLAAALRSAMDKPNWLEAMERNPSATLAHSIDLDDHGLVADQPLAQQPIVESYLQEIHPVQPHLDAQLAVRLQDTARLAEAAGLGSKERKLLLQASALLPAWAQTPQIPANCPDDVRSILQETQVGQSPEGLPVVEASGKLSKLLVDGWQGWMASPWCDLVAEEIRQKSGHPDNLQWLERSRILCSRSPWQSPQGRKLMRPNAKKQESRLRKIIVDLLSSPAKTSKAPARQPELKAV